MRVPGAWSGVVTLKPTYGVLSRHGLIPLVNSLDVPGIFAANVNDIVSYFNVLKGSDKLDSTTLDASKIPPDVVLEEDPDLSKLTIGVPQEYFCEDMSEETIEVWSQVADLLEDEAGVKMIPVSLPHTKYSITCYQVRFQWH